MAEKRVRAQFVLLAGITLLGLCACQRTDDKPLPSAVTNTTSGSVGGLPTSNAPNDVRAASSDTVASLPSISPASPEPLRIAYSRDAGFEHWAKVEQSGALARRSLAVQLTAYQHTSALEAFSAGRADAVTATNAELLVNRQLGSPCTAISVSWVGTETEVLFAQKKYDSVSSLAGKTIGVELGQPEHLALERALSAAAVHDVRLVNVVAEVAHREFTAGTFDAVILPHTVAPSFARRAKTARRLELPTASTPLSYGVLCVREQSLATRRAEWTAVASAWRESVRMAKAAPVAGHSDAVTLIDEGAAQLPTLLAATRELDAFYVRLHVYSSSVFDAFVSNDVALLP